MNHGFILLISLILVYGSLCMGSCLIQLGFGLLVKL